MCPPGVRHLAAPLRSAAQLLSSWAVAGFALLGVPQSAHAGIVDLSGDLPVSLAPDVDHDVGRSALALDPVHDDYLAVWTVQDATTGAGEITAGLVDGASRIGQAFPGVLSELPGTATSPAVAFDPLQQRYLVVWSQAVDAPGAFEIFGRFVEADGTVGPPSFRISGAGTSDLNSSFDALEPDVAGDGEGGFLVVWSQDDDSDGGADGEFDVAGRRVAASGGVGAAPQRLTFLGLGSGDGFDALAPAVEWFPDRQEYLVVFEGDNDPTSLHLSSILFLRTDRFGSLIPFLREPGATEVSRSISSEARAKRVAIASRNPDLAYDPRSHQMLVVWDENTGATVASTAIVGSLLQPDLSSNPISSPLSETFGVPFCSTRNPRAVYSSLAGNFLVAWSGKLTGAGCPVDREIYAREVGPLGTVFGTPLPVSQTNSAGVSGRESVLPALVASRAAHVGVMAVWSAENTVVDRFDLRGVFLQLDRATDAPPAAVPQALSLGASPNPFNPSTEIALALPASGRVRVEIFDLRGQHVRTLLDETREAGQHQLSWDGHDDRAQPVASGVYFVRMVHPEGDRTLKVALVK